MMPSYRLYCLDGVGRIGFAESIDANDDAEALALAQQLKSGALRCEVWAGRRLVGSLHQDDLSPRSLAS
jgi:hypothetical protein